MLNAADIAQRCANPRERGAGWQCCCPAHDDRQASLSVDDGERGTLLKCHAGCAYHDILAALGLQPADLMLPHHTNGHQKTPMEKPRIVATYDYHDATGALLFQSVRYEPKGFRQRRPSPTVPGSWLFDLKGITPVLYHLPEVLAASQVLIVEGEKDADALAALGYVATTSPMGAGKWKAQYNESLAHCERVILLPDNDDPGRKHMAQVARALKDTVPCIRIISLPVPEKGDVSDWLAAGHTRDELDALIVAALQSPMREEKPLKPPKEEKPVKAYSAQGTLNRRYHDPDQQIDEADPEAWRANLLLNREGEPTENAANIALLLDHLPESECLWWDSFAEKYMLEERPLADADIFRFARALTLRFRVSINRLANLTKALEAKALQRPIDPLMQYLNGLEWDGIPRLESWLHVYMGAENTPKNAWAGTMLCCAMVARGLLAGVQCRLVVIFEGEENIGKSKACRVLGGQWTRAVTTGFDAKETIMLLRGCWLLEIEELNAMRRSEEAVVKAFISRTSDSYIPKYSNFETTTQRRTVLVGTVNPQAGRYLHGETDAEDTRYVPVVVGDIDIEGLEAVRDQLFAEAKAKLADQYAWWEVPSEVTTSLMDDRAARQPEIPLSVPIQAWLERSFDRDDPEYTTTAEILEKALGVEQKERWTDRQLGLHIGKALRRLGWVAGHRRVSGRTCFVWRKADAIAEQDDMVFDPGPVPF